MIINSKESILVGKSLGYQKSSNVDIIVRNHVKLRSCLKLHKAKVTNYSRSKFQNCQLSCSFSLAGNLLTSLTPTMTQVGLGATYFIIMKSSIVSCSTLRTYQTKHWFGKIIIQGGYTILSTSILFSSNPVICKVLTLTIHLRRLLLKSDVRKME